jgi:hypothetical protein
MSILYYATCFVIFFGQLANIHYLCHPKPKLCDANIQINVENINSNARNLRNKHCPLIHTHTSAKRWQISQSSHWPESGNAQERHPLRAKHGQDDATPESTPSEGKRNEQIIIDK